MEKYSVKELSQLAGVSAKTLHYYDQIGLLKPMIRTEARYRYYGREELLRLQQILFFKELDFPLKQIFQLLDDPEFDSLQALSKHKAALKARQSRIDTLIATIDKTINHHLRIDKKMLEAEELYQGLSKEEAKAYRREAVEMYGKKEVETAECSLKQLNKDQIKMLKSEQQSLTRELFNCRKEEYSSKKVQDLISRHYVLTRKFWGTHNTSDPQIERYTGLGELYVNDERFTLIDGEVQAGFAKFLCNAMSYFAKNNLRQ